MAENAEQASHPVEKSRAIPAGYEQYWWLDAPKQYLLNALQNRQIKMSKYTLRYDPGVGTLLCTIEKPAQLREKLRTVPPELSSDPECFVGRALVRGVAETLAALDGCNQLAFLGLMSKTRPKGPNPPPLPCYTIEGLTAASKIAQEKMAQYHIRPDAKFERSMLPQVESPPPYTPYTATAPPAYQAPAVPIGVSRPVAVSRPVTNAIPPPTQSSSAPRVIITAERAESVIDYPKTAEEIKSFPRLDVSVGGASRDEGALLVLAAEFVRIGDPLPCMDNVVRLPRPYRVQLTEYTSASHACFMPLGPNLSQFLLERRTNGLPSHEIALQMARRRVLVGLGYGAADARANAVEQGKMLLSMVGQLKWTQPIRASTIGDSRKRTAGAMGDDLEEYLANIEKTKRTRVDGEGPHKMDPAAVPVGIYRMWCQFTDGHEVMDPERLAKFLGTIGYRLDEVASLLFFHISGASTVSLRLEEFALVCLRVGASKVDDFKHANLDRFIDTDEKFKECFMTGFHLSVAMGANTTGGTACIQMEDAAALVWVVLGTRWELAKDFVAFIQGQKGGLNQDQYEQLLAFSKEYNTRADLDDYDSAASWPSLFDEFVESVTKSA